MTSLIESASISWYPNMRSHVFPRSGEDLVSPMTTVFHHDRGHNIDHPHGRPDVSSPIQDPTGTHARIASTRVGRKSLTGESYRPSDPNLPRIRRSELIEKHCIAHLTLAEIHIAQIN